MTIPVATLTDTELDRIGTAPDQAGLGALHTERGNLPLDRLDVRTTVTGLLARTELTQGFRNPYPVPLEATYIFPLPDRAAVTALRMQTADRTVDGVLREREAARQEYDEAIAAGRRAAITEQERPDVFTMRVGNIPPGERVTVRLTLDGPLPYEDGAATFRFPLVVAPRYIPGDPIDGVPVGDGTAPDTGAVPDASRITPPVLLPGFPNPVTLRIETEIDPAGLPLAEVRSSLHAVRTEQTGRGLRLTVAPGERADRDFLLRLRYGQAEQISPSLVLAPDPAAPATGADHPDAPGGAGTFQLTVLPPADAAPPRPRDVVLVLDRSGSMEGWKMVAARRAAARIVDTLTGTDRFAVLLFDNTVEYPDGLPAGLVAATDRNRFQAVRQLAGTEARGGTELLTPLTRAADLLTEPARDRVLVLVTDGQVGNEDHLVRTMADRLRGLRVHTVGIDQAVNAGFLGRLAVLGGGRCELVESEDRLDEAMAHIHRRIGAPVVTGLRLEPHGIEPVGGTVTPDRLPDLFPGAPLVLAGRYRSTAGAAGEPGAEPTGALTVHGTGVDGQPWSARVPVTGTGNAALAASWARSHLRDLEDRYTAGPATDTDELERRIVATSLRFNVLCRFTAFVAVDSRVVTEGGVPHRVTQPVEQPAGWARPAPPVPVGGSGGMVPMAFRTFAAASGPPHDGAAPAGPAGGAGYGYSAISLGPPAPSGPPGIAPPRFGSMPETALVEAQAVAAEETRRLREEPAGTAAERLARLADLGSRLTAVLDHLLGVGADPAPLAVLRTLAEQLRQCERPDPPRGADLVGLWRHATDVLAAFAAGKQTGTGEQADGQTGRHAGGQTDDRDPAQRRRGFWKRS